MGKRRVASSAIPIALLLATGVAFGDDLRLLEAVKSRQSAAVTEWLGKGVDVNASQPDGTTALHYAAQWDEVQTAAALVRAGAKVDAANDYGVTPSFLAATNGSASMLELLLKAGASPGTALPTGETLLMSAARTGNAGALRALLSRGADPVAAQKSKGQTALMFAAAERHLEAVQTLLEFRAPAGTRSLSGFTALLFAAREGDVRIAERLVDAGADLNDSADDGSTPLLVATVRGHVELARWLLARGARPDGNAASIGYTPLHWAAGTFESIMSLDYPVESGEWTALAGISDRQAKLSLINVLLDRGADINARVTKDPPRYGFTLFRRNYLPGATPFYLAALSADVEVMRLLATRGADAKVAASDKTTPLMVAAGMTHNNESRVSESARLEAVTLAIELGNDLDATNAAGQSAAHAAAYADHGKVIDLLAARGANLSQKAKNGQTPLGLAEGHYFDGSIVERLNAAAALRQRGAASAGRAMKDTAFAPPAVEKPRKER
jgi:ankyrin repeat protein